MNRYGLVGLTLLCAIVSTAIAGNVELDQTSDPAGIVIQTTYPALGSVASTFTAPANTLGYSFAYWTVDGGDGNGPVRINDLTKQRAANPATFTVIGPASAVAHYLPQNQDSDNDGLPDAYEIEYFGNLSMNPLSNPSGDGIDIAEDIQLGLNPLVFNQMVMGGISRRRSPSLVVVPDSSNYVLLTETSSPPGIVANSLPVVLGSTVPLATAPASFSGYDFIGWFIDGVRVDLPTQNQPISITANANTTAVARYIAATVDTDGDGIPDWIELFNFNTLNYGPNSDVFRTGIPVSVAVNRGYALVVANTLDQGGVSRRRSVAVGVSPGGYVPYRIVSSPPNLIQQSSAVPAGTTVTTPDLNGATYANYRFVFWDVNEVRQKDPSGCSLTQASFMVNASSTATAHYVDSTLVSGADGVPDWYKLTWYGTTAVNATDDTDGDGLSLAVEYFRGYSPVAVNTLVQGGVSRRRSVLTAVNVIRLTTAPDVTLSGATNVTINSATLNAFVNPLGLPSTAWFEWGLTAAYGNTTAVQDAGQGNTPTPVSVDVSGLQPATVYHFRVSAQNAKGTTVSGDCTFSTLWNPEVASEGFEDPNVLSRWQVTGGVWQSGPPTHGPSSAFADTNCAGTGLTANYPANADSRLISPLFVVPAMGQRPQLGFTHWWQFGTGDYGAVEIREGTTGVWQTLATFSGTSGDWLPKSLDLSDYAGQSVQVAFHMLSDGDASTGPGWFVNEVHVSTNDLYIWDPSVPESFSLTDFYENWTVTGTVWECGTPTSGPGQAFVGDNCAATALAGNYPNNADSRLVSPFFNVAAADQRPRLRFWQWYQFGSGDFGAVEIRPLGGKWETLANFSGSGTAWSRPAVDLSDYAGQLVQVAFRIHSDGWDTAPGWYLDEVSVATGADVWNNPETFDDDVGDWYPDATGIWQIGPPTSGPGAAHSGSNVAGTVLDGYYPPNSSARLISPSFTVGDPGEDWIVTLKYWEWFNFASGDGGKLQISVQDGVTWSEWTNLLSVSGPSSGWQQEVVNLSAYKNKTVRLGFLLTSGANSSGAPGWYIDDIEISTVVAAQFNPGLPVTNTLTQNGDCQYYILNVGAGGAALLQLDFAGSSPTTGLYIRRGALPTLGDFDFRSDTIGSPNQQFLIPFASPGTWYVMVYGAAVPSVADYTLTATVSQGALLESVNPTSVGNALTGTLSITGAGFTPTTTVELAGGGVSFPASSVSVIDAGTIIADFDFTAMPAGAYQLTVTNSGQPVSLPFTVTAGGRAQLVTNLIVPSAVGRHSPAEIYIEYANTGNVSMPAPLLVLTGTENPILRIMDPVWATSDDWRRGFWTSSMPAGWSNSVQLLGSGDTAGVLKPGEKQARHGRLCGIAAALVVGLVGAVQSEYIDC